LNTPQGNDKMNTTHPSLALADEGRLPSHPPTWPAALWPLAAQEGAEGFDSSDAHDQLNFADRADRSLLRLVLCAAVATLVLALACSVGA
jgi:hypothetical protein